MKRTLISMLVATSIGLASIAAQAGTVVVNGSTTVLPAMQKISETFMKKNPDIQVSISGGGSGNGIKALIEKTTDVAMASRDIKPEEAEAVKKNGGEANRIVVAIDAIVPVVHPNNKVSDLTLDQIRDIYAGRITNWKDVGGADARITVVSRDSSSGTFETWESLVMKGLKIGGMEATMKTAETRQWPLSRELYLFTNGQPKGDTKTLVDYALSAEGQATVKEVGFVPLPRK